MRLLGLLACVCGAYGYTLLSDKWISILLGSFLLLGITLRRVLRRYNHRLSPPAEVAAGVILISILMSTGLAGSALVATDGAFIARAQLKHIPPGVHAWFMAPVAATGAVVLVLRPQD